MASAQKAILFESSREQLDALLLGVCEEFQLSPTRYDLAVERYGTVNELLEQEGSPFRFFRPRIFPQGSMALNTTCKPVKVLTIWILYFNRCSSLAVAPAGGA